jgi:hypothetical protein
VSVKGDTFIGSDRGFIPHNDQGRSWKVWRASTAS